MQKGSQVCNFRFLCYLTETKVGGKDTECRPTLELTSALLKGQINSNSSAERIEDFFTKNNFSASQKMRDTCLFAETKSNNFTANIKQATLDRL